MQPIDSLQSRRSLLVCIPRRESLPQIRYNQKIEFKVLGVTKDKWPASTNVLIIVEYLPR